ncbi:unnamed protein product [Caenorhabditis auriculariae]|uniref:Uncharacterized protein n=1 Tax=Caenorhabditis auriculariae TaxID=2777116 RepID=A0A8S1HFD2_9PELO|nr:unnamed protein product [Caenorhabditis auriculariae]
MHELRLMRSGFFLNFYGLPQYELWCAACQLALSYPGDLRRRRASLSPVDGSDSLAPDNVRCLQPTTIPADKDAKPSGAR